MRLKPPPHTHQALSFEDHEFTAGVSLALQFRKNKATRAWASTLVRLSSDAAVGIVIVFSAIHLTRSPGAQGPNIATSVSPPFRLKLTWQFCSSPSPFFSFYFVVSCALGFWLFSSICQLQKARRLWPKYTPTVFRAAAQPQWQWQWPQPPITVRSCNSLVKKSLSSCRVPRAVLEQPSKSLMRLATWNSPPNPKVSSQPLPCWCLDTASVVFIFLWNLFDA